MVDSFVDLLGVLDQAIEREKEAGQAYVAQVAARAAAAELIEAVTAEYHTAMLSRSWPAARRRVKAALARVGGAA